MTASIIDECTSRIGDQGIHVRKEAESEALGNDFSEVMNKTYLSITSDPFVPALL
jgi:hypothetical protein